MIGMVSNSSSAPQYAARGRSVKSCGRFQGLRDFRRWHRSSVRFTDESDTSTPFFLSAWCTCSAQRRRPILSFIIASTVSIGRAFGLFFGFDDRVDIGIQPVPHGLLHQRETVLAATPTYRATFLMVHFRYFTNRTASMRTFGRFGLFVYAMQQL